MVDFFKSLSATIIGSATVVAGVAFLFTYFAPASTVEGNVKILERKIDENTESIKQEMKIRREARDQEIKNLNDNVNEKFQMLFEQAKKIDDRLYDIQRSKDAAADLTRQGGDGS